MSKLITYVQFVTTGALLRSETEIEETGVVTMLEGVRSNLAALGETKTRKQADTVAAWEKVKGFEEVELPTNLDAAEVLNHLEDDKFFFLQVEGKGAVVPWIVDGENVRKLGGQLPTTKEIKSLRGVSSGAGKAATMARKARRLGRIKTRARAK